MAAPPVVLRTNRLPFIGYLPCNNYSFSGKTMVRNQSFSTPL